jgi:uncharacterized protein YoxC
MPQTTVTLSQSTEIILVVFIGLVALALLVQGIALIVISRKVRDIAARFDALSTKLTKQVDALTLQAESLLGMMKSTTEKVRAVQESVTAITSVVHHRVVEVDAFINEATDLARLQMARLQDVIETTARRIDETIDTLQNAVIVPITEAYAIVRGIRSGLNVLFSRRRFSSDRSHQDDEMFI